MINILASFGPCIRNKQHTKTVSCRKIYSMLLALIEKFNGWKHQREVGVREEYGTKSRQAAKALQSVKLMCVVPKTVCADFFSAAREAP